MDGLLHLDLLVQLLPEVALVLTALTVLILDVRGAPHHPPGERMRRAAWGSAAGLVLAIALLRLHLASGDAPAGTFVLEGPTQFLKQLVLLMTLATVLLAVPARFTTHIGEFFALLLLAAVGLLLLAGTENLLMLFVALELVALSLYVLTALNERLPEATEAALKYFLLGGVAAALTLFGLSLLYGLTGSLQIPVIGARLATGPAGPLAWAAIVLTLSGLGFKVAVAPFHFWTPDVYQGAPTPAAAFIATGSKVVGFLLLLRVVHSGFGEATAGHAGGWPWRPGWLPVIAALAVASMLVGNLTALRQSDLRRLLAYSAVAQAGYGVLGLLDPAPESRGAVLYFAVTYAIAVLGAFGVIGVLESAGEAPTLGGVSGLMRRSPLLAACLGVFLLSLAGIPPLSGFFGKFFVFVAAVSRGSAMDRIWIVGVAVATSAIALYYYLQVLKHAWVLPGATPPTSLRVPTASAITLIVLALLTVLLGVAPGLLLGPLGASLDSGAASPP
ncbi:MAG: NADH-quinone oxidoreductase subunit N [Verrucomicrobiae bacterium]|nr:NADH-quinone oxidoreductase subunit N [Verrucomicrobiae bacterium]